jgi:hypothetical protein
MSYHADLDLMFRELEEISTHVYLCDPCKPVGCLFSFAFAWREIVFPVVAD